MSYYDDASLMLLASGGAQKDGKVYSVKPTDGSGDFTFTRGSNLSATRVNASQLIEKGRENEILQSNSFSTSPWVLINNSTLTSGQSGYDGSSDAWLLSKVQSQGRIRQSITASSVVNTFSIYAKANASNWLRFLLTNGGGVFYDLQNGAIGTSSGIDSTIEQVGAAGWYRCTISVNNNIGEVRVYPADGDGNTGGTSGSIYIQDSQLEQGLVSTSVIETGASTAQAGILENTPRFDYSGGATCPSLLLEPSRTNGILQSEYFNSWTKVNVNITDNNTTSPEGLQNAGKITPDTTNSFHYLDTSAVNINSNGTASVYAKAGGYNKIALRSYFDGRFATFNLNDGTLGNYNTASASIEDVGNGWYRCSLNENISSSYGAQIFVMEDGSTNPTAAYQGDNIKSVYLYGFQLEPSASYPTSYIPTYGVSQTRAFDNTTLGSLQTSSILNGTKGTLLFEGINKNNQFYCNFVVTAQSNTNSSLLIDNGGGGIRLRVWNASGGTDANISAATALGVFKYLIRWDNGNLEVFLNGASVGTATINAYSYTTINLKEGAFSNNLVNQFLMFPTALSDLDCEILTGATTYNTFAAMALALNYTVYE